MTKDEMLMSKVFVVFFALSLDGYWNDWGFPVHSYPVDSFG